MERSDRVALADGWTLWRYVVVRGAGFAIDEVLRLAAPDSTAAVERLLAVEREEQVARGHALAAYRAVEAVAEGERKAVGKAAKRLRAGLLPAPDAPPTAELAALRAAVAKVAETRAQVERCYAADTVRVSQALRDVAREDRFREAVAWQNRNVIQTAVDYLVRQERAANDSRTRQNEGVVASYLQRYCTKNDSIGYFGPIGYARVVEGEDLIRVRPGPALVDVRRVYFEHWGIDALARVIAADPEIKQQLAPRRVPTVRVEGSTLYLPVEKKRELPLEYARLLAKCDGERSACAIATELCGDPELEVPNEEAVYEMLDELVESGSLRWTLEVPTAGEYPERFLRAALARLPAPLGERALAPLAQLEAKRDAVASAAGDAAALCRALEDLDQTFTRLTQEEATRRGGEVYAGRTLLYEDCRRDATVEIGRSLVERLAPPLTLLLKSARWYLRAVAVLYRQLFDDTYRELAGKSGSATVDFVRFFLEVRPHLQFQDQPPPFLQPVLEELHARWSRILQLSPEEHRVQRSVASVRDAAAGEFAAPGPLWPQARHQCPDVLIAAASPDAIARGDCFFVLGELHLGLHTFTNRLFLKQNPDERELLEARRADLGGPIVSPVLPRAFAQRTSLTSSAPEDLEVDIEDGCSWRPREQVMPVAELVVGEHEGNTVVRTRDGRRTFDVIAFFEEMIADVCGVFFTPVSSPGGHAPRITIDDLVISRETWKFDPGQLSFAQENGPDRFIAARRWVVASGLPRFVFAKIPEERKPCFIDLESPVFVETLSRWIRKASRLTLSEMLPTIDQTWLPDAQGKRYTCELRLAAVDPEPWRAV